MKTLLNCDKYHVHAIVNRNVVFKLSLPTSDLSDQPEFYLPHCYLQLQLQPPIQHTQFCQS